MLYDIYEVRQITDDKNQLLEKIYQPTEPMYDSNALIKAIKTRVFTQTGIEKDEIKIINVGQTENIGGEPPAIG